MARICRGPAHFRVCPSARDCLIFVCALLPAPLHAGWEQDYIDGKLAYESADYQAAEALLTRAIASNATASADGNLLGKRESYVPQLYLALTYYELGQCDQMTRPLTDSGLTRVLRELPRESRLRERYGPEKCNPNVAHSVSVADANLIDPMISESEISEVESVVSDNALQIERIKDALAVEPLAGTGDALGLTRDLESLLGQHGETAAALVSARAGNDRSFMSAAYTGSKSLESKLALLGERVASAQVGLLKMDNARLLEQARKRGLVVKFELDQRMASAQSAGVDETVMEVARDAEVRLRRANAGSDLVTMERAMTSAKIAIKNMEDALAVVPKVAPGQLRTLVSWYLEGNYDRAAGWDDLESLPDSGSRAHALLVRGAARWHLYIRGGALDGQLIASVDSDLRSAKRLDGGLSPNSMAFSPKLLDRYARL